MGNFFDDIGDALGDGLKFVGDVATGGAVSKAEGAKSVKAQSDALSQQIQNIFGSRGSARVPGSGLLGRVDPAFDQQRRILESGLAGLLQSFRAGNRQLAQGRGEVERGFEDFTGQLGARVGDFQQAVRDTNRGFVRARRDLESAGDAARNRATGEAVTATGNTLSRLVGSGLSSSTAAANMQRGVMFDAQRALTEVDSSLAGLFADLESRRGQAVAGARRQLGNARGDLGRAQRDRGLALGEADRNIADTLNRQGAQRLGGLESLRQLENQRFSTGIELEQALINFLMQKPLLAPVSTTGAVATGLAETGKDLVSILAAGGAL